ncbi:MAG: hypothetical protein JSR45_17225 [Proteobacteria bacterium]|nr:hypothetical protein [Pseudomonadota bacterium]
MTLSVHAAGRTGEETVPEALRRAGIDQHSLIQITGPDGFATLLWLCRHGFENVGYVRSGAPCPAETPDALFIPHACTGERLAALLDRGPRVHPGGVLVLRAAAGEGAAVETVLRRFGYRVVARLGRRRREVCLAQRAASLLAAA